MGWCEQGERGEGGHEEDAKVWEGQAPLQHCCFSHTIQTQHGGTGVSDKELLEFVCLFFQEANAFFSYNSLAKGAGLVLKGQFFQRQQASLGQAPARKISAGTVKIISMKTSPVIRTGRCLNRQVPATPICQPGLTGLVSAQLLLLFDLGYFFPPASCLPFGKLFKGVITGSFGKSSK